MQYNETSDDCEELELHGSLVRGSKTVLLHASNITTVNGSDKVHSHKLLNETAEDQELWGWWSTI